MTLYSTFRKLLQSSVAKQMHLLAMTGSSSKWMLPLLLLLLFMPFHHSSPVHVNRSQFDINVAQLFKKCGNNSSLTEVMCQPFNVSEPRDKCDFLQYYIDGLKSLHHSISSMASIRNLIIQLGHFKSNTCLNCAEICNPNAGVVLCLHKSSMSPLDLHTQLEELGKRINTCQ